MKIFNISRYNLQSLKTPKRHMSSKTISNLICTNIHTQEVYIEPSPTRKGN